jgi:hypothetical protein
MNNSSEANQQDAAMVEVSPSAKRMLRVVYIMGVILVLLFLTLIGTIIWKAAHRPDVPPVLSPASLSLGLPQGTDLREAELSGDTLVINTGQDVIVIDLRKNAVVSRISASH